MQAVAIQAAPEDVRAFIQEYFDAWKGTDEHKILAYYSDDVVLHLPTGILEGKTAVRDNFVRPFIAAFPGNVHAIRNLAHAKNLAAVEWSFEAVHKGPFCQHRGNGEAGSGSWLLLLRIRPRNQKNSSGTDLLRF
jgi:hypothetical protein